MEGYAGILPPFQRVRASACVISRERKRERKTEKERKREWTIVVVGEKISVCREARNAISRSPDVDESCQREMCFGNSGWKRLRNGGRRKRENEQTRFGKVSWREKKKETDRIKSDFQSSVNIYDFQEANYRAKSVWGWADRETVSRDWDRPHNFEIN